MGRGLLRAQGTGSGGQTPRGTEPAPPRAQGLGLPWAREGREGLPSREGPHSLADVCTHARTHTCQALPFTNVTAWKATPPASSKHHLKHSGNRLTEGEGPVD